MHVVEYIVKGTRPRKPITILWGESTEWPGFFKRVDDVVYEAPSVRQIISHVTQEPLFTEPTTMWLDELPAWEAIEAIKYEKLCQHLVINHTTKDPIPELDDLWKERIAFVEKNPLTAGSKNHKAFLAWIIRREFSDKEFSSECLDQLVDKTAELCDTDILYAADNLVKFCYLLTGDVLTQSDQMRRFIDSVKDENWAQLLTKQEEPALHQWLENFFTKSRLCYRSLQKYQEEPAANPLMLLKVLEGTLVHYLNSSWALKSTTDAQMNPVTVAQGKFVPRHVFMFFKENVSQKVSDNCLWQIALDVAKLQHKYRLGYQSWIPIYTLCMKYVGPGI
jgi:hypothetical protein